MQYKSIHDIFDCAKNNMLSRAQKTYLRAFNKTWVEYSNSANAEAAKIKEICEKRQSTGK